jgi:uncharacterized protein
VVSQVLPGYTRTEFAERAGVEGREIPGPAWMDADTCARLALAAAAAGKPFFIPGALNKVAATGLDLLPRSLTRRVASRISRRL